MKKNIVLDMNLTEDFALAFFKVMENDELNVLGITLSFGETDLGSALKNTNGMLALFGRSVPVYLGAARPLVRDYLLKPRPMLLDQEINGLQIDCFDSSADPAADATEFLHAALSDHQDTTIFCGGPLTNIARLLQRYPEVKAKIHEIVWRGGTQRHANIDMVKDKQTLLDPEAAQIVLESGVPLVMCPVDIGCEFAAGLQEIDAKIGTKDPLEYQYLRLLKKRWCDLNASAAPGERNKPLPLQEVASELYLTHPELFTVRKIYGEVDLKGKYTFGMLVIDIQNRLEKKEDAFNIFWLEHINAQAALHYLYERG